MYMHGKDIVSIEKEYLIFLLSLSPKLNSRSQTTFHMGLARYGTERSRTTTHAPLTWSYHMGRWRAYISVPRHFLP